jgi:hypothetical protein
MKMTVFWDVTSCSLVEFLSIIRAMQHLPDDGGNKTSVNSLSCSHKPQPTGLLQLPYCSTVYSVRHKSHYPISYVSQIRYQTNEEMKEADAELKEH